MIILGRKNMDVRKVVTDVLAKRCDISNLKESDNLSALGLDSLDLVEVLLEIEEALHVEFDVDEIAQAKTLKDILDLIQKKI